MVQLREVSLQADAALQQCLAQLQVRLTAVQSVHSFMGALGNCKTHKRWRISLSAALTQPGC